MIKALVFDLDGTLVNTEILHYRAWEKTLLDNGLSEFSFTTFLGYVGSSNEKVAADHAGVGNIAKSAEELVREKQATYMGLIPEIQLCTGVREILEIFKDSKVLAIASSSHRREVLAILENHGLDKMFAQVICGDMVKNKKPHPESYQKASSLLGVAPDECVAFEDSGPGLSAAKNAGMFGIAIPNEFTARHDFSRADRVVKSLLEVDSTFIEHLTAAL